MKLDEKHEKTAVELLRGAVEEGYRGDDLVLGVARVAAMEIDCLLHTVERLYKELTAAEHRIGNLRRRPFDLFNNGGDK